MKSTTITATAMALGLTAFAWAEAVAASSPVTESASTEAVRAVEKPVVALGAFEHCWVCDDADDEPHLDPVCFLEALAKRYRALEGYRDVAQLVQVTSYDGETAQRIETEIGCNVDDGEISVRTPLRQIGAWIGSRLRVRPSEPMKQAQLQHDLWTAPHLSLFAPQEGQGTSDEPGPRPQLEATEAHRVTVQNRTLIHLAMQAAMTTGADSKASMEFVVDPESMLVEEVRVKRKLADGADHETTLHITPLSAGPPASSEKDASSTSNADSNGSTHSESNDPMRNGRDHSVQEGAQRDRPADADARKGGSGARPADHGSPPPPSESRQQLGA